MAMTKDIPAGTAQKQNLSWIDALRGIAILMVIAVHTSHGLKGYESNLSEIFSFGGFGVQLFFIASAITLCMSLERSYGKERWLLRYAVRRYFRIAPMYYIGIIIYFGWSFLKNYVENGVLAPLPQYTFFNIFSNIAFIHGFVPAAFNDIVPGGWSIAVEMMFYCIFPFIFVLYNNRADLHLWYTLIIVSACYLVIAGIQIYCNENTVDNSFLYFNIANQIQVFVIGILGYHKLESLKKLNVPLLLAIIIALFLLGNYFWTLPILNARFISLLFYSAMFVTISGLASKTSWNLAWLSEIGKRSFSMYVLHFMVMNLIDYFFNNHYHLLTQHLELKAIVHYVVAVLIVFILSGYTKKIIEDRFIGYGSLILARK
jgi:peptidoglycan/LPS O-acetylase OafA/YrhL